MAPSSATASKPCTINRAIHSIAALPLWKNSKGGFHLREGRSFRRALRNVLCRSAQCASGSGRTLDVDCHRIGALAALVEPGRAVAGGAPQTAALPTGVRIVDAGVEALGVVAH